jgi:transcriptional regulator with PAS, ATPase and Fis domain
MPAEHLNHDELLEPEPDPGLTPFAERRALLIDAVAMGLLRKHLVENFSLTAARAVLTQLGFAHGWPRAEAMKAEIEQQSEEQWRSAGTRIHALEGDFSLQRVARRLKVVERKLTVQRRALVCVAPVLEDPRGIVANSAPMRELVDLARRVAKVDSTTLITGESGSGKERIARLVHEESTRRAGPFIAVNCGAITETLLEAELFGHARGAFTGAMQDRPGLFEAANGGTLLLDEVGEVSPAMQVKLLRALQEHEVRRVGETRNRKVNVRILAATNRDLAHGVAGGAFRQDLYYRLKVVELHVPALRDRKGDLLPLAHLLLANVALRMKRKISGLSPAAVDQLVRYAWPGNVRELGNAMERAVALARGERVEVDDLPEDIRRTFPKLAVARGAVRPLEDVEKDYILAALELNGGNQTHTAEQLRIGSATLYRRLKSYGLSAKRATRTG